MKRLFLNYLAVAVIVLSTAMTGCNNENPEPEAEINGSNDPNFWKPQKGDVYVAGSTESRYELAVATVWKNGVAQYLADGMLYTQTTSIFVSGNDVYVAGFEININTLNSVAILWKNGIAQNLTDGISNAKARSVFVSGSYVYVAGTVDNFATVWKNGVAQHLGEGGASSVFVSNSDVYVAGTSYENLIDNIILWKNGVAQILPHKAYDDEFGLSVSVFVVE